MLRQLQAVKMELGKRMHDPIAKTGAWLHQMLKGYLNYYAVSGNSPSCGGTSTKCDGAGSSRSSDAASVHS
jgi:hypothetical protein